MTTTYAAGTIINLSLGLNEEFEKWTVVVVKELNIDKLVNSYMIDCPYDIRGLLIDKNYVVPLKAPEISLGTFADQLDIQHFE